MKRPNPRIIKNILVPFITDAETVILKDIYRSFDGVAREGGVSWSEAEVLENFDTFRIRDVFRKRVKARSLDTDTGWRELVGDPSWLVCPTSHWHYLDAIGFRYYLPAAMVRCVQDREDVGIARFLSAGTDNERDQWRLLSAGQRQCVGRFVRYMARTCYDLDFIEISRGPYLQ